MYPAHEIAITGVGMVTSLGLTADENWSALLEGRIGFGPMADLEQRPISDKGGAQAVALPTEAHRDLPRASRYLRHAIDEALHQAHDLNRASPDRIAVILGTTLHGMRAGGEFLRTGDARWLRSFLGCDVLDAAVRDLAIEGPRLTICSACSSGLSSIALGMTLLRAGQIDLAVCGGYDTVSEYAYAGFDSLRLIAERPPAPFGNERQGMKVGEGYGVVVLERLNDAVRDGNECLAILAGIAETSDAFHLTQPHPEGIGAAQAIRLACREAGVAIADIGMISAHGTATPNNDASEYAALLNVFSSDLPSLPVVAFKSRLGHTLGGAGAIELILSGLALRHNCIPSTANTDSVDSQFAGLNLVRHRPVNRKISTTINLSLGFGGSNTCAVLTSHERPTTPIAVVTNEADDEPVITGLGVILTGAVGCEAFSKFVSEAVVRGAIEGGPIPEQHFSHLINARRTRRMSEYAKLTLASATAACMDAGVLDDADYLNSCSVILGSTHGASSFCESYYGQIVREGIAAANPVLFAEGVPNAAAAHLSMMLGIRGGCLTIIGARSAGLDALMLGSLRIRQGACSRMIISAAEEHATVVNDAYRSCGVAGKDQSFVTGSGTVSLVLESRRSAQARDARILGAIRQCAWRSGGGPDAAANVVDALGRPLRLVCAHGPWPADRFLLKSIRARFPATSIWSLADRTPELFSVGPLAALTAALLGCVSDDPHCASTDGSYAFGVLASEFNGASSGTLIERAPITRPGMAPVGRDIEGKIK